jgi:hypothetical protein
MEGAARHYQGGEAKGNADACEGDCPLSTMRDFHRLGTRSFWFFSQDFFDRKRKIKFRFFLVDVERDF